MSKPFYIVPSTKSYYETVDADSKEDALVTFATGMADDMSAYFEATEKEPTHYPHSYEHKFPDGNFELAMSIIVASMTKNTASPYYGEHSLDGVNLTNMDAIAKLQEAYDTLYNLDRHISLQSRKKFYKILKDITGFKFDKKEKPDPTEKLRVHIRTNSNGELLSLYEKLDKKKISYDTDGGNRLVIERQYLKQTLKTIDNMGLKADVL